MAALHLHTAFYSNESGNIGTISVAISEGGNLAALYADNLLSIERDNPVILANGEQLNVWVSNDALTYSAAVTGSRLVANVSIPDLSAYTGNPGLYALSVYVPRYFQLDLVPQLGGLLGEVSAYVNAHNTSTLVALYEDEEFTVPHENPFVLSGVNISFWAKTTVSDNDLYLSGGNLSGDYAVENIYQLPGPIWANKSAYWQDEPNEWAWIYPYTVLVKTVQNVGQLYTANDLIRGAFRLIQVAASDTTLTASELNDGLESLNRMLDSWSADELTLYQIIRESFSLTNNQNPYTIGYGGDFDTSRPIKIVDAQLNLYNANLPVTYPMQVLQYDDYNSIRLKTLATNFPQYLYYNPAFPLGEILIYPVFAASGTSAAASITLSSWKPIDLISDPNAAMSFPPGYWEALVFNLAIRMAEEYQFDIRPQTMILAAQALKRIKQQNRRVPTLSPDAALMNTSQRRYNIYSDGYGA